MRSARHFYIAGKVQHVYFRAATQQKAQELGLNGWVRNLADGRVEAFAEGDESALRALEDWLWDGPEQAQVDEVAVEDLVIGEEDSPTDFRIL